MTTLRLDAGAAETIAAGHDTAAATIDGSAGSAPGGCDAGIGTGQILGILSAVTGTAADLAALNHGLAAVVRHVGNDIDSSDTAVANGLSAMGDAVR